MNTDFHSFRHPSAVKHEAERTFRHDRWVELLKRTCRSIARICKQRQVFLLALLVEFFETLPVHVNFAAHFQKFRRSAAQSLRYRADRTYILRDVVADISVPARRRLAQLAVFVNER